MDAILKRFQKLDTTCVSDAMDKIGVECACYGIKPVHFGQRICGRAFTVHYAPCGAVKGTVGDFLDDVAPGQVIVIDNAGRDNCTVWGDIMAKTAKKMGVAGTVIDGVCRDLPALVESGYAVFSKGYYMRTGKDRVYVDAVNVPVTLSDIPVRPGDIVIGDDTGVVVVPDSVAERVAEIAENIDAKEQEILALVEQGHKLKEARELTGYHHLQTKEA